MAEHITIDFSGDNKPFRHFYSAFGYANTDFAYTSPYERMHAQLTRYSTKPIYMRLHNILTTHGMGDYYLWSGDPYNGRGFGSPCRLDNGTLYCDWTVVDKVYDSLLRFGLRPIVELERIPPAIKDGEARFPAPISYQLWYQFVRSFMEHLKERYGTESVAQWYFESWNEPDNEPLWGESPDDLTGFFRYYDATAQAVKDASPRFRIGGPATKQSERAFYIFEQFLVHCTEGTNTYSGETGAPLDFISVHCKGVKPEHQDQHPAIATIFDDVRRYLDIARAFPALAELEFFNDESDVAWTGRAGTDQFQWLNFRNTHYYPGFVCKMVERYCRVVEDQYGRTMGIMDSDNCHLHWERSFFSGNRSQFTPVFHYPSQDLIKKPIFNAFHLLSKLGNRRLCLDPDTAAEHWGVLPTWSTDRVAVLVWNFEDDPKATATRDVSLSLRNLPVPGPLKLLHYAIDSHHSSAYGVWERMGFPLPFNTEQLQQIRQGEGLQLREPPQDVDPEQGSLTLQASLEPHSVSLFVLSPAAPLAVAGSTPIWSQVTRTVHGDPAVFLHWTPVESAMFSHYRLRRTNSDQSTDTKEWGRDQGVVTASFTDSTAVEGRIYQYTIEAVGHGGEVCSLGSSGPVAAVPYGGEGR